MNILRSIIIAFSCFSAIPMPTVAWTKYNMRLTMAVFPLVGAIVGLMSWLWWLACDTLGFGSFLRATGIALLPIVLTGGIHMDGFTDVVDAHSSHADPKHKRQILKDPHTGAFAVVGVCSYLLGYVGLASELDKRFLPVYLCVPIVSRCLSAYMAVHWPGASSSGMFATIGSAANKRQVGVANVLMLLMAAAVMLWCSPIVGAAALVVAFGLLVWLKRFSSREFGGMSGDLLGFYVQVAEFAMLTAVVVAGKLV